MCVSSEARRLSYHLELRLQDVVDCPMLVLETEFHTVLLTTELSI